MCLYVFAVRTCISASYAGEHAFVRLCDQACLCIYAEVACRAGVNHKLLQQFRPIPAGVVLLLK